LTPEKIGNIIPIQSRRMVSSMLLHVMIALDDSEQKDRISKFLSQKDIIVERVENPHAFWREVPGKTSDLLIVDRELITDRAVQEIRKLHESKDFPAIVVLSGYDDDKDRHELIAAGCQIVLNPELSSKKLKAAINSILNRLRRDSVNIISIPRQPFRTDISDFVAKSSAMKKCVKLLPRIAKSNSSILILGETGVGKERLAHAIHAESPRSDGPFIAVHCGALPESLLESELFGHEQGAFTGATQARRGCFELAHMGTIFLDEIGEMPLHLQSKLLRILEDQQVRRVGSEKSIGVDIRIVTATNRDLEVEVRAKQFRRDLYYRLNVVSLMVPALRERIEDIPELAESYIEYLGRRIGRTVSGISKEALGALCRYSWPGNVRELINVIERAMLLCENDVITPDDLPKSVTEPESVSYGERSGDVGDWPKELMDKPLKEARNSICRNFEKAYLVRLLKSSKGRVGEVAKRAGVDSRSVFDKMKEYELKKEDFH
jgi:two-component system response regulator AtoC